MIRSPQQIIVALERECLAYDKAFAALKWGDCVRSFQAQRRLTHELDIAMRGIPADSPEAQAARQRVQRLMRYRDGQIERMKAFHDRVGKRLATLTKFRAFAKTRPTERPASFLDIRS